MSLSLRAAVTVALALTASTTHAATQWVRLAWDTDSATSAVVGFSPSGTSTNPYLLYGESTDESLWKRAGVSATRTFSVSGTLTSHFVRLSNLKPASAVYFRACDDSGCGTRHWFRTSPNQPGNATFISGGDSRSNAAVRQAGNRLVAKIRPEFITFGGDLTYGNTVSELQEWLTDWALSMSDDTVNGVAYKRIYPLVLGIGNHESPDLMLTCKVFGVDGDGDGQCSLRDTYYATPFGGTQLRIYSLNTEVDSSTSGNAWIAQKNWLSGDLANTGALANWRMAHYHKAMYPRTTSKPTSHVSADWKQLFYDYKMNIVEESDSHIWKYTYPVAPGSTDYVKATAGTVYIGEGSWGAPKRAADRTAAWGIDQGSFDHFHVMQFVGEQLTVRTVRFDGETNCQSLSHSARTADPLALPAGLPLHSAAVVGEVMTLNRDAQGRTQLVSGGSGGGGGGGSTGGTISIKASADVTVASNGSRSDGSTVQADAAGSKNEVLKGLVYFPAQGALPAGATLKGAKLKFTVTNSSAGAYSYYAATQSWTEAGATYAQASQGAQLLSHTPSSATSYTVALPASALPTVQNWLNGIGNFGLVIVSQGTTDGLAIQSSESSAPMELLLDY